MNGSEDDRGQSRTRSWRTSSSDARSPAPGEALSPAAGTRLNGDVRLLRELGSGGMAQVWLAEHLTLGIEVAVKFLRHPDDRTMRARLAREAQVAARLDHPGAVRVVDHGETDDGAPFVVMELVQGESLAARIARAGALSLADVRRLVKQLADVLSHTHERGIVHRDIKPDNIMLIADQDPVGIKVVDFGIAKPIDPAESTQVTDDDHLVGTPLFMAPEQLFDGHPAGAHADLWGLALVTYEALVARRPFSGHTRAALGLAIVMRRYEAVTELRPELPPELDDVFDRALRLDATERYASADAFAEAFDAAARGTGKGAVRDRRGAGLRIPEVLYGRDRELPLLRRAFELAATGGSQVVLVSGYSGIGKTALVAHAQRELVGRSGILVSGKFDQFDRGTPYQSVVHALRELIRRTQRSGSGASGAWSARVASALGEGARVLLEVIPELEEIVGTSPPLEEVSPAEARHRFQNAMNRLASALASPEHPLVVFLDDLQWADLASIDLITNLATDPESRHVLLLGAYRDSEVDHAHPLTTAIERMRAPGASLHEIALGPLDEDAVLDLVSDTFPKAAGRARLASACRRKTHGNAFFLRRFLEVLHEEGAVRLDRDADRWTFDFAAIEERAMSEEVVDFVLAELERLPAQTREALQAAACIGDHFDVQTLAAALATEPTTALDLLRPALAKQLVTPPAESAIATEEIPSRSRVEVWFAHDRIRQAARSSMDEEEAARVHRVVGLYMLDHLQGAEREQRLFELVEHLNRGFVADVGRAQASLLLALNLTAARRALASAAFHPAHAYFQRACAHLTTDAWSSDYDDCLALHVEGARAAYLAGDYASMQRLVDSAVENGRGVLDRVAAREVELQSLVSQQRLTEAVSLAIELLRQLGHELPPDPSGADVEQAVTSTLGDLKERASAQIAQLPKVNDPRIAAIRRIQNATMSSAYLAVPNLLPILASHIVRSTLEHGVSKESPYGFAVFALVLTALDVIDVAYATGKTAVEMLDRVGERSPRPKTLHVVAAHVSLFVDPVRDAIEADRRVARLGVDTGDLEYAAWGLHCMVCNAFYGGVELDELAGMYAQSRASLEHQRQLAALGCTLQYGQAIANLRGQADDPARLVGPDYDEERHRSELEAINFRGAAFILSTVGTFVRYLFGDLEGALAVAERGRPYADGATATYHLVWWHQYRALARLRRVDVTSPGDVAAALRDAEADVARLKTWQRFSAVNHDHRMALVEGELARVSGRTAEALARYDAAAAHASKHGFLHEGALARELAGLLHLAEGDPPRARTALLEACDAYDRWGASAKSAQLREQLATIFVEQA